MAVYIDQTRPNVRPTLNLDFANSRSVDNRITFTRTSSATYYDERGVLQTARNDQPRIDHDPVTSECRGLLVEGQRTNILTNTDAVHLWLSGNLNVLSGDAIAPDGKKTAVALVGINGDAQHYLYTSLNFNATTYTLSVYLKAGEVTQAYVELGHTYTYINLTNGVTFTTGNFYSGWNIIGSSSVYVGNGWYRLFITSTCTSAGYYQAIKIHPTNVSANLNGDQKLYFWGPQIEEGTIASSYIPSSTTFTSRASSATYFDKDGVLRISGVNQPRYGYGYDSSTGQWLSTGLIVETAATNQFLSSNLGNWVLQGGVTRSINSAIGPDGLLSATTITTNSEYLGLYRVSLAYSGTTFYTTSVFVKAGSTNTIYGGFSNNFEGASAYYFFNLSSKTITTGSVGGFTNSFAKMIDVGNGWYRLVVTAKTGEPGFNSSSSIGAFWRNVTAGTAYYYGVQFETGSMDSSYIPTYGSSLTRAADVSSSSAITRSIDNVFAYVTSFPQIQKTGGTFFVDGYRTSVSELMGIGNDTFNNSWRFGTGAEAVRGYTNANFQIGLTSGYTPAAGRFQIAAALSNNNSYGASNGTSLGTDTSCTVPTITTMRIGMGYSGQEGFSTIRRISYWPNLLTLSELEALTK